MRTVGKAAPLLLLAVMSTGCGDGVDSARDLAAYQRLVTSTASSAVPPSHVYCGGESKDVRGPGRCASKGTNAAGRIPAYERTEMRGWIVNGPGWVENDEESLGLLLDWGWAPVAGIRSINTPEKIVETVTPFNVVGYGVAPTDRTGGRKALLAQALEPNGVDRTSIWGGPNAAVIHVENQGWRFQDAPPPGWTTDRRHPDHADDPVIFSTDLFRPDTNPPLVPGGTVGLGDYVRLVGTQWEDGCHCADTEVIFGEGAIENPSDQGVLAREAMMRWIDGSFGQGVDYCPDPHKRCTRGRGWTEMHPVDYIAKLNPPTHPTDTFEMIAMAGASEIQRSITLPPKPSSSAHAVYREIDSPFTLLNPGDLASKDVVVTSDGIDVHIKLNPRSGVAHGYPKFFAGFYVAWEE